jgi:hypothetical protein
MAAATQQFDFPWKEDKPLSYTLNKLANNGRIMTNMFIRDNSSIFEKNKFYIPFQDLHDFLGYTSLSSKDELSLLAYSFFHVDGGGDGKPTSVDNTVINTNDVDICMYLGKDFNQFIRDNDKFSLYINGEPFFVNVIESDVRVEITQAGQMHDNEVNACIQLFNALKTKRPNLTSSQFVYILLGMQQKNMNQLTAAFSIGACKGALKENIHKYKYYATALQKSDRSPVDVWLEKISNALFGSFCGTLNMNPKSIRIGIFLPHSSSDNKITIVFNLNIPIICSYDVENPLFILENFNFFLNLTGGGGDEYYYEMTDDYLKFIVSILNVFYTIFITYPLKPGVIEVRGQNVLINFTPDHWNLLKDSIPQEIETMKAEEATAAAQRVEAEEATAAAQRVEADVFSKLGGGKRKPNRPNRKKASSLLSSKQHFSRKNKSRRRKNKSSRRKN